MEKIVLAGGCFWCTEAIFKRLIGVLSVKSGYANTNVESPDYMEVSSGKTGAAEAVEIEFDPKKLPLERILEVFWATHNPTSLNKQGADVGTQYRSAIFYENEKQKAIALESKSHEQLKEPGKKMVTEISELENFTEAEEYHQNYYDQNKNKNPYCPLVIDPKIKKLMEKFGKDIKEEYK